MKRYIVLILTALLLISCTGKRQAEETTTLLGGEYVVSVSAPEVDWVQSPSSLPEQVIEHSGYVTSYNPGTLVPNWVYYELLPSEVVQGGAARTDVFSPDPLVNGKCSTTEDYIGSGMSRGHLAPAADFKYSAAAMEESFLMTNVAPQDRNLNAGAWNDLEQQVRFWCKNYYKTPLWVISGVIVDDNARRIGSNKVAVPSAFWKVICRKDSRSGQYEAIGFMFPNKPTSKDYTEFAVPIDSIEEATGLDFMHILPLDVQDRIEGKVTFSQWKTRQNLK